MDGRSISWDCWVNEEARVISFHEIKGYQWQFFRTRTAFWLYVKAKTIDGFKVI